MTGAHEETLDLKRLPNGPIERLAVLLPFGMHSRLQSAISFIHDDYAHSDLLLQCLEFIDLDLLEAVPGDIRSLRRVWYFPWTEAERDCRESFQHALMSFYKPAHDHLRRALELVVCGCYFTLESTPAELAEGWMSSERETPLFSRAVAILETQPRFATLGRAYPWKERLQHTYWDLCDVTHVRGVQYGYDKVQPSHGRISGFSVPEFRPESLSAFLDRYLLVVRQIATILAAAYPVLLVGQPLDEKFGLNGPMSGLFNRGQAELLRGLILDDAKAILMDLAATDEEVRSLTDWVFSQPDLSEDALRYQAMDLEDITGEGL